MRHTHDIIFQSRKIWLANIWTWNLSWLYLEISSRSISWLTWWINTCTEVYDQKWKSRTKTSNEPDTISFSHVSEPGGLLVTSSKLPPPPVGQCPWATWPSTSTSALSLTPPEFITPDSFYAFTMYKNIKDASQSYFTVMWEVVWDRVSHSPGTLTNPTQTMTITSP